MLGHLLRRALRFLFRHFSVILREKREEMFGKNDGREKKPQHVSYSHQKAGRGELQVSCSARDLGHVISTYRKSFCLRERVLLKESIGNINIKIVTLQ